MVDVGCVGGQFTWRRGSEAPQLARLDRFLLSASAFSEWPLALQFIVEGSLSDHSPLLLRDSVLHYQAPIRRGIRFDLGWLSMSNFRGFIINKWATICSNVHNNNPLLRFGKRLKELRREVTIWGSQERGNFRKDLANV